MSFIQKKNLWSFQKRITLFFALQIGEKNLIYIFHGLNEKEKREEEKEKKEKKEKGKRKKGKRKKKI